MGRSSRSVGRSSGPALAVLLLARNEVVSRDRLVEALWGTGRRRRRSARSTATCLGCAACSAPIGSFAGRPDTRFAWTRESSI